MKDWIVTIHAAPRDWTGVIGATVYVSHAIDARAALDVALDYSPSNMQTTCAASVQAAPTGSTVWFRLRNDGWVADSC